MLQSQLFYKTLKKAPKTAEVISHKLLIRGDFISQLASGVYSFLPLGYRVHKKIENIIRQEINSIGGQEVFLPSLQPKELWQKTNRWDHMDPPLFRIKDRHKKEFALGSTHEEVITDLAKTRIQSYKDLPLALYQIQTKFRNEMRFTGGLLRTREFVMKDLYSFHSNLEDLDQFFKKVLSAYDKIYKRCGLKTIKSEASGGVFTKEKTYEFQVLSEIGEDKIIYCPKCNWATNVEVALSSRQTRTTSRRRENGESQSSLWCEGKVKGKCPQCKSELIGGNSIEVGHTFRLGTKYSKDFDLNFISEKGEKKLVQMGCYGMGIGRLMATIIEINHDEKGIIWPAEVAPFQIHLIQIENSQKVKKAAVKLYRDLQENGGEVLYDNRNDKTPGEKFVEADLIGIPVRLVVSEKTLKKGSIEIKKRRENKIELVKISKVIKSYYVK